jgi:hypothetical protein
MTSKLSRGSRYLLGYILNSIARINVYSRKIVYRIALLDMNIRIITPR